ncbi:LysM peptidoglycan-binding domain-containing protein [Roseibium sp.]|uniref:LysM peptidoglycan-binding domain-containing protein n=1 Tax=Roseibium sp. TaxID=1936156 RepID=UPI003264B663
MNKTTLVWTLIAAVPVGLAALATAYVYRDTGKLPFQEAVGALSTPEVAVTDTQPQAGADPAPSAQNEQAATSAADDAAPASAVGPSFDVVGVEPTGETVVAGRSDAGAIVALTANGKVVGKSIANDKGEWTIILDEPLKPGDYDVGVEVHDEAGTPVVTSQERLAVSLPEGGKEQPLIVLNTPDGPSDILQKPAPAQQVAEAVADPAGADEEVAADAGPASETGQAEAELPGTAPSDTEARTEVAALQPAAETPAEPTPDAQTAAQPDPQTPAPESEQAAAPESPDTNQPETAAVAPPADEPAGTGTATAGDPAQQEQSGDVSVAAAPDDSVSVDTSPADPAGTDTAAASQETAPESSEAGDPIVQQAARETAPEVTASAAPAAQAEGQAAPDAPTVTVEAVESETDKVFVAGTGEPGSSIRVYVGEDFQGEVQVNTDGKWLVQGDKNIAEGNVEVRADLIGKDGNAVDARAAVTFEKERDRQIVLTKVVATGASGNPEGQGAEVRKSLPVVIIRKGDNLWRISRRLYGEGLRYTTIYQANQEQIRNPDLIYPGQVFLTPEGDLNWEETPENNG